ncbi:MAG: hypothetical protein PVG93_04395 [Phycisphaerales bacterium]
MKTTALLVLVVSVLGPGSFFGTGKKAGSLDPWRWARTDKGHQRTMPERRPEREIPNEPSMKPSQEGQMMEREATVEDANDKEWQQIKESGEKEGSQWLRADAENIAVLAKSVNEQSQAELQWLRAIAEQEQASETVKAIDKLLAMRSQRYEQVIEKAKDERRQRMLQRREEKRSRGRERRSSRQSKRTRTREPDGSFGLD